MLLKKAMMWQHEFFPKTKKRLIKKGMQIESKLESNILHFYENICEFEGKEPTIFLSMAGF